MNIYKLTHFILIFVIIVCEASTPEKHLPIIDDCISFYTELKGILIWVTNGDHNSAV